MLKKGRDKCLKICLIGPGSISFYCREVLKKSEEEVLREIDGIAKILASKNVELMLLPDRGLPLELAIKFKKYGGKKVIGLVPLSDKEIGIEHIKKYLDVEVDSKKLFDELIDTGDWYKHNIVMTVWSDVVLILGLTPSVEGELGFAIRRKFIEKKVRVNERIPLTFVLYRPLCITQRLFKEVETYAEKKLGRRIIYINSKEELTELVDKLIEEIS